MRLAVAAIPVVEEDKGILLVVDLAEILLAVDIHLVDLDSSLVADWDTSAVAAIVVDLDRTWAADQPAVER